MKYSYLFLLLAFWSIFSAAGQDSNKKPNILFILADDAGYADFGFQGSTQMKTPNLDKLAAQGMKFTQAYTTAAVCGPSRAGLYTGKYQQRFGYEENNVPGYMSYSSALLGEDMGLPLDQVTVAEHMRKLGYNTGLIGKWHQGNADRYHPTKRGFNYFYGLRGGSRSYYALDDYHRSVQPENKLEFGFRNFQEPIEYLTKALADNAVEFIHRQQGPFFLMLSLTAVHTPMEAEPEDLAKFQHLPPRRQTLAAMTLAMDREIGKVLEALDKSGVADNTLVVFTNDNGAPSDTNAGNNFPLSGTKANHLEGGIRVPLIMRWPRLISANTVYEFPVSFLDFLPTFVKMGGGSIETLGEIDGVALTDFILGKLSERPHKTLFWKKENRAAIRDGDWKLLRFPDRPAELYNLSDDVSENHNLAMEYPNRVRQLYKKLFEWETSLERPLWQLERKYEGLAMERMDKFRHHEKQ
ncbi:sulfatase-like hydrolase/transferase [Alteromonas macleodii]|uniref:Arylsulfatase, family S1_19 n=1 Tax=Alteromonas macleodii TaxID=28108 RepID=A0A6T9Y2J7_ALTMA|nr:sulfatase-like hydrolase/transferase [Alteromonas macleodii]CAB9493639.1 Arylsulfatase, family S1_19 [Alteromonas macleodii]